MFSMGCLVFPNGFCSVFNREFIGVHSVLWDFLLGFSMGFEFVGGFMGVQRFLLSV